MGQPGWRSQLIRAMLLSSGPHSTSWMRRCLPDTTVMGPLTDDKLCRV